MLYALYRGMTGIAAPLVPPLLAWRTHKGLEDRDRSGERRGRASVPRPAGRLLWIHAASVGETRSTRVLIERLLARDPALNILLTTWTVAGGRTAVGMGLARVTQQFAPFDRLPWVRGFLDHWRPDLAIWIESELWPNLVVETAGRGIPMALVNGRMSPRSFRRWRRAAGFARLLLDRFRVILPWDHASAEHFRALGARGIGAVGNLKFSADPPEVDPAALAAFRAAIGARPVWLAVSTHEGEEEVLLDAHRLLAAKRPDLLTLIAPRHPRRTPAILELARGRGLTAARRTETALPAASDAVFVVDTIGEMGLMMRTAPLCVVGGSLVRFGGHNPIEPAQLGAAILYGPHMWNFSDITAELEAARGAAPVAHAEGLAAAAARLFDDPAARQAMTKAAAGVAARNAEAVISRIMSALEPLLVASLK
jgi:3-deoxy-D-manno-octulosonic-acid transferase